MNEVVIITDIPNVQAIGSVVLLESVTAADQLIASDSIPISVAEVIVSSDNVSVIHAFNSNLVEMVAAKETLVTGIPIMVTQKETIYTFDQIDSVVPGKVWGTMKVGISIPVYPTVSVAPVSGPIVSVASKSGTVTGASVAQVEAA
jgi:hypothetical protein